MLRFVMLVAAAAAMSVSPVASDVADAKTKNAPQQLDGLFLKRGDSVFFTIVDGQPANVRKAEASDKAAKGEISISLSGDGSTMMSVLSNADEAYQYQAWIARGPNDRGQRTSVCTLLPGVTAFESWPGSLPGIRIGNFEPAKGGMMSCR